MRIKETMRWLAALEWWERFEGPVMVSLVMLLIGVTSAIMCVIIVAIIGSTWTEEGRQVTAGICAVAGMIGALLYAIARDARR